MRQDFRYYVMHYEEDSEGFFSADPEKNLFYIPLRAILILYNEFVALSGVNSPKGDCGFYVKGDMVNTMGIDDAAFSIDPSVCVLPYATTDPEFEGCWLRKNAVYTFPSTSGVGGSKPERSLKKAVDQYNQSGEYKKDTAEVLVCSLFLMKVLDESASSVATDTAKGMMDFIDTVLKGINGALGNTVDLDINFNHTNVITSSGKEIPIRNHYSVVDRKGIKVIPKPEQTIDVTGLNNTVLKIDASSKISSEMTKMISIAAQGSGGTDVEDLNTLVHWNLGSIDRHMPLKLPGANKDNKKALAAQKVEDEKLRKAFVNGINKMYDNFNNYNNVSFNLNEPSSYTVNGVAHLQNLKQKKYTASGEKILTTGVIPIELSIDLDGIFGFTIGACFNIRQNFLPAKYNDYGYIITGLSHSIGADNKWVTSVTTNFYPSSKPQTS